MALVAWFLAVLKEAHISALVTHPPSPQAAFPTGEVSTLLFGRSMHCLCTEETVLVIGGLNGSNSDLSIPQVCSIIPLLLWSPSRPMLAYGPSLTQTLACRGEYRGGRGCMEYLQRRLAYLNTGRQEKEDSRTCTTKSSRQYV